VKLLPLLPGALHLLQKSQRRIYLVYSTHLDKPRPYQLADALALPEDEEYDDDDDDVEWI
jgi:hypothetical protein